MKGTEFATVFKYAFFNIMRAKWILFYMLIVSSFAYSLLRFSNDAGKTTLSLLNVVLLIVPMVSSFYGSVYWYNSDSFIRLLLTQPIRRTTVFLSTWIAISSALAASFAFSIGVPILLLSSFSFGNGLLIFVGTVLTFIFTAIGILIAILNTDRMKGTGLTFVAWLYFAILHDAVVFFLISSFNDYPIEVPSMLLMALNPIDLGRVILLLALDLSAMMGYTGRILQRAISSSHALVFGTGVLALWLLVPAWIAARYFKAKDL